MDAVRSVLLRAKAVNAIDVGYFVAPLQDRINANNLTNEDRTKAETLLTELQPQP